MQNNYRNDEPRRFEKNGFVNDDNNSKKKDEKTKEEHLKKVLDMIDTKSAPKTKSVTLRLTELQYATFKAKAKFLNQSMSQFFIEAGEQLKAPGFGDLKKKVEEIYK